MEAFTSLFHRPPKTQNNLSTATLGTSSPAYLSWSIDTPLHRATTPVATVHIVERNTCRLIHPFLVYD
jgi:hypothetical protein